MGQDPFITASFFDSFSKKLDRRISAVESRVTTIWQTPLGFEPAITAGTTAQYWRGDKTWQTLNQAAVAGLTSVDSPIFATVKCSNLTDGRIPFHVSDATGLANSPVSTDGAIFVRILNALFYHDSDIKVLNKAGSGFVVWATRDTSGAESVMNLTSIGGISAAGNIVLNGLTASQPVVTDGTKILSSITYATFKSNLAIAQADVSGLTTASSPTFAGVTLGNTGLHLLDTNDSHDLIIKPGSDLSADRILTITTGDAARTLTINGDATLNDWFDQSVKTGAAVQFLRIGIGGAPDASIPLRYEVNLATWTLYAINTNSSSNGLLMKAASGAATILLCQNYSGTNRFYVTGDGAIYMPTPGTGAGLYPVKWNTGGVITYDTSDDRLKDNKRDLEYGLKEILALRPKRYFHHDAHEERILKTGRETFGLIAQDVEKIMPDVVIRPTEGAVWYGIEYDRIISVLVNAVRELAQKAA